MVAKVEWHPFLADFVVGLTMTILAAFTLKVVHTYIHYLSQKIENWCYRNYRRRSKSSSIREARRNPCFLNK